ncbi:MAG: glycosyltransferase 87 family protein [Gemmataceae bacterium]
MRQSGESNGYVIPARCWTWVGTPRGVSILLWIAAIGAAIFFLWHAWVWYTDSHSVPSERRRGDGNGGHCQIDFGGQWVMGRMFVEGHGRKLYHRQQQWDVVRRGFPVEDEPYACRVESVLPKSARSLTKPEEEIRHDYENLMHWFMGADPPEWRTVGGASVAPLGTDPFGNPLLTAALVRSAASEVTPEIEAKVTEPAIGGPLYPPVHALFYAPIGLIDRPQHAYHLFQIFAVLMVFVTGLGVNILSEGRVRWSIATLVLFLFPGTRGGLDLAQNPTVSLAIVVWGWARASRGYVVAGGAVWGLFAFKPVWGLAFFLVPLLTRRWRFCAAMQGNGWGWSH